MTLTGDEGRILFQNVVDIPRHKDTKWHYRFSTRRVNMVETSTRAFSMRIFPCALTSHERPRRFRKRLVSLSLSRAGHTVIFFALDIRYGTLHTHVNAPLEVKHTCVYRVCVCVCAGTGYVMRWTVPRDRQTQTERVCLRLLFTWSVCSILWSQVRNTNREREKERERPC